MTEYGGPTTQSGIFYQNSVAALYLGRLCDATARPDSQRVVHVRVEAPNEVDDTVVTFADRHKVYIQAKENITSNSTAWKDVWRDFDKQFHSEKFQRGKDRILFQIGNRRDEHDQLRQLCERANEKNEDFAEWQARLTKKQQNLLEKITSHLSPELTINENLHSFLSHIEVRVWTLREIEEDLLPHWMPQTNRLPQVLFRLLRDRVGGIARVRGSFTAHQLRTSLQDETPDLNFTTPLDVEVLRAAVRRCGSLLRQHKHTFANTGQHVERDVVNNIVNWLLSGEENPEKNVSMLLDQAGMGKTVIMRDVLCALEAKDVDVLAIKADQQISDVASLSEVQAKLDLPHSVEHSVERLTKLGRTVVLIDQIDALSLSLAHDQKALNIVLDLIARLRRIPNIRILISCRLFDRNSDPRLKRIEVGPQFTLQELSDVDVKNVFTDLGIDFDTLPETTQRLLQTPLHLDLFIFAFEENPEILSQTSDISSIQELYHLIWNNIILKHGVDIPSITHRIEVLKILTDYMDKKQRTSAPQSLTLATQELEQAAKWLASAGILISGKTEWTFLHQTFFDYCYARHFVEEGSDIVNTILTSNQGLFERHKLIQVMSYLRGSHQQRYVRDLQRLLNISGLRFHLDDLLWRWFGSLPNPTDEEWILAQRILLIDSKERERLLFVMQGNAGWFKRLYPIIEGWLTKEDEFIDNHVIPYLISLVETTQAEVTILLQSYLGYSKQWNQRIAFILSRIREWYAFEAIALFEQVVYKLTSLSRLDLLQVATVARVHPATGCRLIRFMFDQALNEHLRKQEETMEKHGGNYSYSLSTHILDELRNLEGRIEDTLRVVSEAEPILYVKTMLPWLERVLFLHPLPDEDQDFFVGDTLSYGWYENVFRVQSAFIHSLIASLITLAKSDSDTFRPIAIHLASLPYETSQQLLTHIYRAVPKMYADDAFEFLLADQRRLDLGDNEQYDTRQVIKAIYPYLKDEQREKLEAKILSYAPIYKFLGVDGLRRRGIEQFRILQSIPTEYLTSTGLSQFRQLRRKFPNIRASENPVTIQGDTVGSPIPEEIARKMSDRQWLRAMQKYQGSVEHKDFLKGGARQFSGVMTTLIKEHPARFYSLFQQVPDNVDDAYASAFVNGMAESDAPAEWFFNIVRRFAPQDERKIKRPIAWAIEKRCKDEIPDDIVQLLFGWVHETIGDDEWWWVKGENHGDAYSSFLNSDRGSAFRALMRVLDNLDTTEARKHKWELIEFVTSDPSTALRLGAIHELIYMIRYDRERAIRLFEQLMDSHEVLLEAHYVREFLYWAFRKNFLRLQPFITAMMMHHSEKVQEQGAQLACIAALSTKVMESPEAQATAQALADKALTGPPTWRRGAASTYAHNVTNSSMEICKQKLKKLLDDEDEQVRQHIDYIFSNLRGEHFFLLRDFIEDYAGSDYHEFEHQFAEYLGEHGLLDPKWTLSIVATVISRELQPGRWRWGTEELIRLVLRIYTNPTIEGQLKEKAMDVFDLLMEKHSGEAYKVLSEWDRL